MNFEFLRDVVSEELSSVLLKSNIIVNKLKIKEKEIKEKEKNKFSNYKGIKEVLV